MQTPELADLMVYFHEDFHDQGGLWGTLDLYLSHSTANDHRTLLQDIAAVLREKPTDAEVDEYLESLDSYVVMDTTPGGYRGWLEEIARRVRAHLDN